MRHGPKWGKNGLKMAKRWDLGSFFHFFASSGPFVFSHSGPWRNFRPILAHFRVSAHFPFYARRPFRFSQNHSFNFLIEATNFCSVNYFREIETMVLISVLFKFPDSKPWFQSPRKWKLKPNPEQEHGKIMHKIVDMPLLEQIGFRGFLVRTSP